MIIPPDARSDDPFLNDAFDFSRYPTLKTRHAKLSTKSYEWRHRAPGPMDFFSYSGRGSPSRAQRPRNVSDPQLISSTNHMRESWLTNIAFARTVDDVANLSSDDDIISAIQPCRRRTVACETPDDRSNCDDDDQPPTTPRSASNDSCDISEFVHAVPGEYRTEEDSFYSMDSADQEAHLLLLSMPIIPLIKLERKATVRKPDPGQSPDAVRNKTLLSPRIRDLRTEERISSRRYGRILAPTSARVVIPDATVTRDNGLGARSPETCRRSESELACIRSASEPMLNSANGEEEPLSSKIEIDESPHSDVLLSFIDEVSSSQGPSDRPEGGVDELPRPKRDHYEYCKRTRKRSSLTYSISLSSIVHAVADGCASLDLLLRKPKSKPKSTNESKPRERASNSHDPTSRWDPKQGKIIIKVFVPSTDDIWMFRVPQDVSLAGFTSNVVGKLGFSVFFSGSVWDEPKYYFKTDERFTAWVKGRIRFGRNLPIVAHIPSPLLPLVR